MLDQPEAFTRDNIKSLGNFSRLDRRSLRRQQRMSRELDENEVPGITYEGSKIKGSVTCESHVKVRILSPVELPVDLYDGK